MSAQVWRPTVAGEGRCFPPLTRALVHEYPVTVLGSVPFEPTRVRVRMPDGSVRRVPRDELRNLR